MTMFTGSSGKEKWKNFAATVPLQQLFTRNTAIIIIILLYTQHLHPHMLLYISHHFNYNNNTYFAPE